MEARAIIAKLRDGVTPEPEELVWFASGLASGHVSDAQAGAFAMAVLLKGLSEEGRIALTLGMRDSGRLLRWDLPAPVVDKHSTGGVGDCISLLLAPALAAAGVYVPMISGRGLGHTGGTLDKLESIPGLRCDLPPEAFRAQVAEVGCAIVAASADIAPADRRLYALRDVTGTVQSLDLITASILSKKLAAGISALVLDVKCGSGAFMKTEEEAEELARALVSVANGAGCPTSALITDMNQPLARSAGNALEIIEVMETVTLSSPNPALLSLTTELAGEALFLCGAAPNLDAGRERIREVLLSGAAAEAFGRMVAAQGGPPDFIDHWRDRLPSAPVVAEVYAQARGRVQRIDVEALGEITVHLGGGRLREGDRIHPAVGLSDLAGLGEEVGAERPLARVHAQTVEAAEQAAGRLRSAYLIGDTPVTLPKLVINRL